MERKPTLYEQLEPWLKQVEDEIIAGIRKPAREIDPEEPRIVWSQTLDQTRETNRAHRMEWRRERIRTGVTIREKDILLADRNKGNV
jgi:hypothetical protein